MKIANIKITNFRGIKSANIFLPQHGVLIGDNNVGKTTILEALDLVLGPDRLNRPSPINEHDFFEGKYKKINNIDTNTESINTAPIIEIEVTIIDLTIEQKTIFGENYIEFWNTRSNTLYDQPEISNIDLPYITDALRITFSGCYNDEEDDFEGKTYFTRSLTENEKPIQFSKKNKQTCGFLYLRSLRTGSRALSLERGSLLDIILRLKEIRPQMWEDTLNTLSEISVAGDPAVGISPILESINTALKKYVPKEWGTSPQLKISNLTRENLRKIITTFMVTGNGDHTAPFYYQGTGTINMLVLAMLTQIAEDKQNVIFAMEEPETAIPPYAQKRIIHEIKQLASQAIFTSHSPYVLEEFTIEETIILGRDTNSILKQKTITLPDNVKLKRYRQEFRTRFCEGLLARRVLIAEGASEASALPAVARRLAELQPEIYTSLEALGICTINADGETNIPGIAKFYREMGKYTFAVCDKQDNDNKLKIENQVIHLFMHDEKGIENLILNNTPEDALKRFFKQIDWPSHLKTKYPNPEKQIIAALKDYFSSAKGNWAIADFLAQCNIDEIPEWLKNTCRQIQLFNITI